MRSRLTKSMNLASSSHGGCSEQAGQEVSECLSDDNYEGKRDKKPLSEADNQEEEEVAAEVPPAACTPAIPSPSPMVVKEMEEMFLRLGFSQAAVLMLVEDQGMNSPWTLASFSDEDITIICDMIYRPGGLVNRRTLLEATRFLSWPQRFANSWHSCSRQCSIVRRTTGFRTSTAHLCCSTNINES